MVQVRAEGLKAPEAARPKVPEAARPERAEAARPERAEAVRPEVPEAARPERAEAPSPGHRPGLLWTQTCRPVRAKALKNQAKFIKLLPLQGVLLTTIIPRAMPWARSFCPFRARGAILHGAWSHLARRVEPSCES